MTTIIPLNDIIPNFVLPDGKWEILSEKETAPDEKEFIILNKNTGTKYLLTEDVIAGDETYYKNAGYSIKCPIPRKENTLIYPGEKENPFLKYRFEYYHIFELNS